MELIMCVYRIQIYDWTKLTIFLFFLFPVLEKYLSEAGNTRYFFAKFAVTSKFLYHIILSNSFLLMKVLIIFALQREVVDISLPECEVTTVVSGVGKARSAMALTRSILENRPDIVISVGTAGTFHHQVGDIIVCRHVIDRDYYKAKDVLELPCEGTTPELPFIKRFPSVIEGKTIFKSDFMVSCGDNFVTEGEGFGADVVDMESFAEYDVCQELGVPFFAIKYVTDVIGQNSMDIWEKRLADSRTALTAYFKNIQ